jgi:cleavage and polyadenylation specificity factor subunit 3
MNLFDDIHIQFNNQLKRKAEYVIGEGEDEDLMEITPLGAGNEVGRSCIILKFKGKTVMVSK